jgi:hypothetical protein
MAATTCAFCGTKANMVPLWVHELPALFGQSADYVVPTMCTECSMVMVALVGNNGYNTIQSTDRVRVAAQVLDGAYSVDWYPATATTFDFPYAPKRIARAAEEAHQAAQIGAYMGSILMARTTVEATAKHLGITQGRLIQKIDAMRDQGHIRPAIQKAAHQIRDLGNEMAHGDIDEAPTEQDATDVLRLMDAMLRDVFEVEAITSDIISRRSDG